MFNIPIIKQDFRINRFRIFVLFVLQMISMLMAIGICEMNLIEISDIFWDTIPVIIIPMLLEMILAYETVTKCREDGTMDLILATGIKPEKILFSKAAIILGSGICPILLSAALGCLTRVYRLTGEWKQNSYIFLNAGAVCLQIFLSGFSFWMACRCKNIKSYIRTAVLIPVCMYGIYTVYYWVGQLFFLQYVTVFSLYRQEWYAKESLMAAIGSGVFLVAGVVFFFLGKRAFYKEN